MHLTSSPKSSPEIDDTIAQKLEDTAQSLAVDCEQKISQPLGAHSCYEESSSPKLRENYKSVMV